MTNADYAETEVAYRQDYIEERFLVFLSMEPAKCMLFNVNNFGFPVTYDQMQDHIVECIVGEKYIKSKPDAAGHTSWNSYHSPNSCQAGDIAHPFLDNQRQLSFRSPIIRPTTYDEPTFAIFGEAPGQKGCGLTHIPFSHDASGLLLRNCFMKAGYNLDFQFVGNVFHMTPPNNKLFDFVDKDKLGQYDFHNCNNNDCGEWLKLEMKLFETDVFDAMRSTHKFIAVGRTPEMMLRKLLSDHGITADITYFRHPASFFYNRDVPAAEKYYKEMLDKLVME